MPARGNSGIGEIDNTRPSRLAFTLAPTIAAPSKEHILLIAFQFGTDTIDSDHPAVVKTGLAPIGVPSLYECWWYKGYVEYSQDGPIRTARCDDYAIVIHQVPDASPEEFGQLTYSAYTALLQTIECTAQREVVKIWNYFGDINKGEDDQEKYRQFSVGRAKAFDVKKVLEKSMPTGTAIGTIESDQFTIISLSTSREFKPVENPRQVNAYEYPRRYGPRSPKFSRGGVVITDDSRLCVVSGTAAIVGHESQHHYNIDSQLGETVHNLDLLSTAISELDSGSIKMSWRRKSVLRVYLKNLDDAARIRSKLKELLGAKFANVSILHATICRRELVIEIDGASILATSR